MIKRIVQFYHAVTAELTDDDIAFIDKYLSAAEYKLFNEMHTYDKCHAVNVAYSAVKIAGQYSRVNMDLLVRAALLHDIGRTSHDICIFDKVIFVLLNSISKNGLRYIARKDCSGFAGKRRSALYICLNHAAAGAAELYKIGAVDAAKIVECHHDKLCDGSSELAILHRADELN